MSLSLSPADCSYCEEKLGNDKKEPDMKIWKKEKRLDNVDYTSSDWIYTPIIQSGGDYDLKVSAESNEKNLTPGVIVASFGIKYKEYCSSMARTFMISPDKVSGGIDSCDSYNSADWDVTDVCMGGVVWVQSQEQNYSFLLELQQTILKKMKAGVQVKQLYDTAVQTVQSKKPELVDKFVKNIGFGVSSHLSLSLWVIIC